MFIDLVAVELLCAHLQFGLSFRIAKHDSVVFADRTYDVGLRAGADPDIYLVWLHWVDDLDVVRVASLRHDGMEASIVLELFAKHVSIVLGR